VLRVWRMWTRVLSALIANARESGKSDATPPR
jgi:hypothetical protein